MTLFWYCFYLHSVCWGPSLFRYDSAQPALLKAMAVLVCVILFDFIDPTVERDLSCHFKPSKDMVVVLCCFQDLSITSIKSWFIWLKKNKKKTFISKKTCRDIHLQICLKCSLVCVESGGLGRDSAGVRTLHDKSPLLSVPAHAGSFLGQYLEVLLGSVQSCSSPIENHVAVLLLMTDFSTANSDIWRRRIFEDPVVVFFFSFSFYLLNCTMIQ